MRRMIAVILACVLAVVGILFAVVFRYRNQIDQVLSVNETEVLQTETGHMETETEAEAVETETEIVQTETDAPQTEDPALHMEDSIYTFLQGPVAWESKAPYSGIWCESELDGGTFSVFGVRELYTLAMSHSPQPNTLKVPPSSSDSHQIPE